MVTSFFIGLGVALILINVYHLSFYYGKKYRNSKKSKIENEKNVIELEKEIKKRQQGLNNIMEYDIEVAMGRRRQNE